MAKNPFTSITRRNEPVRIPVHPAIVDVAPGVPADIYPQQRPLPPEPSLSWNQGKTFDHAWPHQRVQQQLNPAEWLSVIGWPFLPGMRMAPAPVTTFQSTGGQIAIGTRVNIDTPAQVKLSDLTAIKAPISLPVDPSYLKLI